MPHPVLSLLLVAMPGAPSSVLAPNIHLLYPRIILCRLLSHLEATCFTMDSFKKASRASCRWIRVLVLDIFLGAQERLRLHSLKSKDYSLINARNAKKTHLITCPNLKKCAVWCYWMTPQDTHPRQVDPLPCSNPCDPPVQSSV